MLVISSMQMQAIGDRQLADWLARHLRRFFPDRCAGLGATGLADLVTAGLARARSHGFRDPTDLARYLDVMFALGPDFDQDAALPWVAPLLEDPAITDPTTRMDLLARAAGQHLAETAGAP